MGDPHILPTIVDDMGGLYTHASEAHKAGQRSGRDEFYRAIQAALSKISVEQEKGPANGPEAAISTRGFHVAEACCKAVSDLKEKFDHQKKVV